MCAFVSVPPQTLPIAFGDAVVNAGDVVAVQCMVLKGDLPLVIEWRHNNVSIVNSPAINVLKTSARISTLNIESVRADHRGHFECVASNRAGRAESSAELMVNGTELRRSNTLALIHLLCVFLDMFSVNSSPEVPQS